MMTTLLALAGSMALAGSPGGHWETKPYIQPRANIRAVSVNGKLTAQAILGAEGGLKYNKLGSPWQGRTRLSAIGMYGLTSGSLGADVRQQVSALAAQRGWPLRELTRSHPSLEDVFHKITVRDEDAERGES